MFSNVGPAAKQQMDKKLGPKLQEGDDNLCLAGGHE